jgi:divalent metal cation (Fe/Co/Zn/Cd) transporter
LEVNTAESTRADLVGRGQRLEYFTIAYNSLEGLAALIAGALADSVSLTGFGLDSAIEVASATALLWRLRHHGDAGRREQAERTALRIAGGCFLALTLYIVVESASALLRAEPPARSVPGIVIAAVSVVVMPALARAKRHVAAGLGSFAMHADSRQSDFCAWLSAILLGGLLLNTVAGWWWADPIAALLMAPIIAREGVLSLRGRPCCCGGTGAPECHGQ